MMSDKEDKAIEQISYRVGIKGIFDAYTWKDIFTSPSLYIPLFFSLFVIFINYVYGYNINNSLFKLVEINTSVFPNIIGFNLSAYAIVLSYSGLEIAKNFMKPLPNKSHSLLQKTSAVFAFSVLIQCLTLIISFIVYILMSDEKAVDNMKEMIDFSLCWKFLIKVVYFLILFLALYSINLLMYTVINIFNIGQASHYLISKDNKKKDDEKKE